MKYISIAVMALVSESSATLVQREPLLSWAPTQPASAFKMNYFVPHFGEDQDIKNSKVDLAWAENSLGHKLAVEDPPKDPPRNYFVPHFGVDQDVADFRQSLNWAETNL